MKTDRLVAQARLDSPVGPLTLAATDRGLAYLLFDEPVHYATDLDVPVDPDNAFIAAAARELAAYWAGSCPTRFSVPLDLHGTPFQQAVWQALLDVKPGDTSTYGAIARQVGAPQASRAAELGIPLLRSALTGVTAYVDADGHVGAALPSDVPGVLATTVALADGATAYRAIGQVFAPLATIVSLAALVDAYLRRRREHSLPVAA